MLLEELGKGQHSLRRAFTIGNTPWWYLCPS